ncbi:PHD finger protein [Aspergillus undulatus]|uniref:PHD finger protein n=1 Tax=Aspergillus undulatus TaxID=1810928 RepID=UPI003CCD0CA1
MDARGLTQATPHEMQAESAADGSVAPLELEAFDPSILTMAREFLRSQGGFPESQDFSPDFLLKLGSMMTELELQRERVQELVAENGQLRQDNANIRTYLDSNLATGRPAVPQGSDLSFIRRPSPDTTGKTWDRIVMDLI